MTNIEPLADNVLIERIVEEFSSGGIALVADKEKFGVGAVRAKVLAVGPGSRSKDGSRLLPMSVREGDEVYVSRNMMKEFEGSSAEMRNQYLVVESYIIAKIAR